MHSGLFLKLIERNTPKVFLDILITWYNNLQCRVKWNGHFGKWFHISAGVRQGGILSPDFYNIYVDDLVFKLQKCGIGCYIANIFAAAIFYADDMCVMAPSIHGLQRLLDLCSEYCTDWDICLNAKKSKNMYFGKKTTISFKASLNGVPIEWVTEWKYLGVILKSGPKFGCSVKERVKSFYRSLNSILRVEGRSDDLILLRLIETHCLPILTYAIETIHISDRDERRSMRVAYNSIFRKIFGYRIFESVSNLQHFLNRHTWEELIAKRRASFLIRARACSTFPQIRYSLSAASSPRLLYDEAMLSWVKRRPVDSRRDNVHIYHAVNHHLGFQIQIVWTGDAAEKSHGYTFENAQSRRYEA